MRSIRMKETRFPLIMEDGQVAECEALLLVESSCGTKIIWYTPTTASAMTVP